MSTCQYLQITLTIKLKSKEKHSLTRKLVRYRNWRQMLSKKDGNKVLGKEIYLALLLVLLHLHVQNIGFLSHFLFSKPCSLPFYTTFASKSYIPPTFLLENFFFTCKNILLMKYTWIRRQWSCNRFSGFVS